MFFQFPDFLPGTGNNKEHPFPENHHRLFTHLFRGKTHISFIFDD